MHNLAAVDLSVAVVKVSLMNLLKREDLPTPNSPHRITFCSGIRTLAILLPPAQLLLPPLLPCILPLLLLLLVSEESLTVWFGGALNTKLEIANIVLFQTAVAKV